MTGAVPRAFYVSPQTVAARAASVQGAWPVLTVTLDFDFLLIISVRAVIAAVRFERRYLTLALRIRALVLATHVDNFCHAAPRFFELGGPTQGSEPSGAPAS